MGRKLAAVLSSLIMFAAAQVHALGLGDIILESALNQPLKARIELLQAEGVRAEDLNIVIASASDFERFSIDRLFFFDNIFFNLETTGNRTFVVLSTIESVREPYLNFVLETRWPSGRLLSEYTLLLDLPVFNDTSVAQTAQAPVQSFANDLQEQSTRNQSFAQSSSGSSSGQIERVTGNPDSAQSQADRQAQLAADQTLTVDSSDTLWDIALQVRPDRSLSVQQTMLAIQRLNENAFIGNNINMIRSGQVIRVPDAQEIRALSQQQALSEVSRQNLLFADRRNTPLAAEPLMPPPVAQSVSGSSGRGELSVVSGTADNADSGNQDARIARLEDSMAVTDEELDRVQLQNSELNERLSMLEQQIASAHEIIRLRDLELAQLQQALAAQTLSLNQAVDPTLALESSVLETSVLEPAAVITMAQEKSGIAAIVDALVRNTYALIGGLLLVILLLVMLLRRNRSKSDEFPDLSAEGDENEIVAGSGQSTDKPVYANRNAAAADPVFTEAGFDEFDRVSPKESGIIEDAQADAELLDEVDTLLAYDRISAARVLLQNAIAAEPERNDLRLKLMEVYVADGNVAGFQIEEAGLIADADSVELERIEELRSQLPVEQNNASISSLASSDNFYEFNELQENQKLRIEGEPVPDGMTADPVDAEDIGAVSATDDPEEEFSFDLSDLDEPATDGKQALKDSDEFMLEDQEAVVAEEEIESIDFDFSLDDLKDVSTSTAASADTGLEDPELEIEKLDFTDDADADDFDRNDLKFLSDSDEAATKLDLARAYIDMGDKEGAEEILQEVLKEGTALQINDARSLLKRIT